MATFLSLNLPCSRSQDLSFFKTNSQKNGVSFDFTAISVPNRTKDKLSLQVMAIARFKGTVMREQRLTEMIEKKVLEANQVCAENQGSDECKVAWDEVEEVSQAKADLRRKMEKHDPLESFCEENPETDECRIYED